MVILANMYSTIEYGKTGSTAILFISYSYTQNVDISITIKRNPLEMYYITHILMEMKNQLFFQDYPAMM